MKVPLVLLSGLLSDKLLWEHQYHHLKNMTSIQIISSSQSSPEKMVEAILKQVPKKFALAGHSMGGWLCLEIMRSVPERVQKLCLLNTTARMDSRQKCLRRQALIEKAEKGYFDDVVNDILDIFIFNKEVQHQVKDMFLKVGKEAFINQQRSMMMRHECLSILPAITCPSLVIHAIQDRIFSIGEHRELVNNIKNAKLVTIQNSGHMSPMEAPEQITDLLRSWLLQEIV